MIVSKPKASTLFSIGIFLLICFGFCVYGLISIQSTTSKTGWYVLIATFGSIGLIVLIRILTSIKVMTIRKKNFEYKAPFKFTKYTFEGRALASWQCTSIKTYGGLYEELNFNLKSGQTISLSKQENTEYDKVLHYMSKKYQKIKK